MIPVPVLGQKVVYHSDFYGEPCLALVVKVHEDRTLRFTVNLAVFTPMGHPSNALSVPFGEGHHSWSLLNEVPADA